MKDESQSILGKGQEEHMTPMGGAKDSGQRAEASRTSRSDTARGNM